MSNSKFSPLIRAGAIIHTVDNKIFRCTSKLASNDGVLKFRLADLQGKPVQLPADFRPISPALARFAAWMRYIVAYNKDFDMYVKEYIRAAGLPVDPEMNWAKFLSAVVAPKLISRDPEVQDEALHQIIIKALAERSILDANNPNGFSNAIKKFPPAVQNLPLAKQVTRFLEKAFAWRVKEANEYIRRFVFQDQADSMWGGEEPDATDVNLLDTKDNIGGTEGYDIAEADIEVDRFRKGFSEWLHKKFREDTAEQYLTLFDIVYEEVKASEETPGASDVLPEWYRQVGKRCNTCGGSGYVAKDTRTEDEKAKGFRSKGREECPECHGKGATEGKSNSWFKVLFSNLPKLIDTYITKYLDKVGYDVHPFLEIMRQINKERELAATASLKPSLNDLKLADSSDGSFYGIPVAPMDKGGNFVKDLLSPSILGPNPPSSGRGGGAMPPLPSGSAGGGAAEGLGAAVEELAPLAAIASTQWAVPSCKACGGTQENPKECVGCHSNFCAECMINHHANNPSHNHVASMKIGSTYHYINGTQHKVGGCSICKKADGEPIPGTAPEAQIGISRGEVPQLIEDVIGSGLFENEGEPYFSWEGCEYCADGLGATVTDFQGYRNLEDAQAGPDKEYEFRLCNECLNTLYYGEQ